MADNPQNADPQPKNELATPAAVPDTVGPDTASAAATTAEPLPSPSWFDLRRPIGRGAAVVLGIACLAACFGAWWFLTKGSPEERLLSPSMLPSPKETIAAFPSLWFDRELTRNTLASLRRVVLGFGLAVVVGVPLGVFCGCFPWVNSLFAPLTIAGRNIPVAALIPLSYSLFGIGEPQKVMFLFIACVAFVIFDTSGAINDVSDRYIDTAYTLGARRRQIILKVLFPLALPAIFNSLRLLFGLAFGYIMLAELIKFGGTSGGLGDIINVSQRRGIQTHILLVLMIIPLVALAIDRLLYWIQRELFPYRYNGSGVLHDAARGVLRFGEDLRSLVIRPKPFDPPSWKTPPAGAAQTPPSGQAWKP